MNGNNLELENQLLLQKLIEEKRKTFNGYQLAKRVVEYKDKQSLSIRMKMFREAEELINNIWN